MNIEQSCLTDDILHQLERNELSPQQVEGIEAHLTDCTQCQQTLNAADSVPYPNWEAEICPVLRETFDDDPDVTRSEEDANHETFLRLLGPSDDPKMLGRVGGYEVVGVIGQGGMGVVFKAFDTALNRFVAIKMLLPHLTANGAARKRFLREAQAAAAVVDDHVLPIFGVDQWQGTPYLVMQYSRGTTLQKRLQQQGPLSLKETLRIGLQTARGLAVAHAQGLVHRDVKPANILLDGSVERAVLMDFGLARAVDDASLTRTGIISGTPMYMSPEQVRADSVDARSDLFSLGSTLYAMCAGWPPFRSQSRGESAYGVMHRITHDEPTPICEVNSDVPVWLGQIIDRLMSKQVAERFESAAEVADLLEGCLAHVQQPTQVKLPASAAPTPGTHKAKNRWLGMSRRKKIFSVLAAGTALVAAIAIAFFMNVGPPDISGQWIGDAWGQVILEETQSGHYLGKYGMGSDGAAGTITVSWSRFERQFIGSWNAESSGGDIALRLDGENIRGAWTADEMSPRTPNFRKLADLNWRRRATVQNSVGPALSNSAGETIANLDQPTDRSLPAVKPDLLRHILGRWKVISSFRVNHDSDKNSKLPKEELAGVEFLFSADELNVQVPDAERPAVYEYRIEEGGDFSFRNVTGGVKGGWRLGKVAVEANRLWISMGYDVRPKTAKRDGLEISSGQRVVYVVLDRDDQVTTVETIFPTPEAVLDRLSTCETFEDYVGLLSDESINELAGIMLTNSASMEAWIQLVPDPSSGRLTEGSEEKIVESKALLKDSMLERLPAASIRSYRRLVQYYSNNLKVESGTDVSSDDATATKIELTDIDLEAAVGVLKNSRQFVIDMSRLLMPELDDSMAASVRRKRRHWKVTKLGDDAAVANYVGPVDPEDGSETNLELRRFGNTWKIISPVVDLASPDEADAKTPFVARFVEPDVTSSALLTTVAEVEAHLRSLLKQRGDINNAEVKFIQTSTGGYEYRRRYHVWKTGDKQRCDVKGPSSDGLTNTVSIITPEYVYYNDIESEYSEFSIRSDDKVRGNASVPQLTKFGFVNWNVESLESHSAEDFFLAENRKDVEVSTTKRNGQALTVVKFKRIFDNGREGWGEFWLSPAQGNYPVYLESGLKVRDSEKTDLVMSQQVQWRQCDNIWFPERIERKYQRTDWPTEINKVVTQSARFNVDTFPDVFDPANRGVEKGAGRRKPRGENDSE